MDSFSREAAEALVKNCGGVVRSGVSGKTNFLVIGPGFEDGRDVTEGTKYRKAKSTTEGQNKSSLEIINKNGLFKLIIKRKADKS
mmetsp:Transcript_61413/g.181538  ORF Transcript_61413/g.181538 Transcript_61413/m.181538 type:complete len:85 (-) Transcript_61413:109-363(-)